MKIVRLLIALFLVFMLSGCSQENRDNGFAIYLVKNLTPQELIGATPAGIQLEDEPVIAMDELISYTRETHELEVKPSAFARIKELDVPVHGRPFAVCLGRKVVYTGAFWTPISSVGFSGIIIMKPLTENETLQLAPGYPSDSFYRGNDPRNNTEIFAALEKVGKLR